MVAQTGVSGGSNGATVVNGFQPTPPIGLFHRVSEFAADIFNLGELQVQLFAADGRETFERILVPAILMAAGAVLLVFSIPLAMATSVVALVELGGLSWLQGIALGLGIWLALGGIITLIGLQWLRQRAQFFARSLRELDANATWVRTALQHFAGKSPATQGTTRV